MTSPKRAGFPTIEPDLQISFYRRLQEIRALYLHESLKQAVKKLDLRTLDGQLSKFVDARRLKHVASFGLRGEVFFPVPVLLEAHPFLLGYYRLLFGLSQKEFYNRGPFARFARLEREGEIPGQVRPQLPELCASLVRTASLLVDGLENLSLGVVAELQLLTLGPQLRGGQNTKLGREATREVFRLIQGIVARFVVDETPSIIRLKNSSRRAVTIEFASDPDVRITEALPAETRQLVSIEVKGGADVSNIHNRLGEAEKSHQKAKARGFRECWTIIRAKVDPAKAKQETPTTGQFFNLDKICDSRTAEHRQFRNLLCSLVGIRA